MATLKDLSEYTGYSIATISRILNSDPSMSASEETRKKVLEAANTLNYAATKSRKGRNLKTVLSLELYCRVRMHALKNTIGVCGDHVLGACAGI